MANEIKSAFEVLNGVNCNAHVERKNGLTYLSWAWAWAEVKKRYPQAFYTVYETPEGRPYFDDGKTCWVKTGVTIEGLELIEILPVMDNRNNSIPLERITSMDMNKAIQRSLTKACARHGLGLYIYAGEDLPEGEPEAPKPKKAAKAEPKPKTETKPAQTTEVKHLGVGDTDAIEALAKWAYRSAERVAKARDGYDWEDAALKAFYNRCEQYQKAQA